MRFLQIFLFVISYTFSRTLIEFKDWQENFEWQAPLASSLAILFLLLLFVLPAYVPVFLELMALPPFLDKDNLSIFFAVIDEGFATRFKHEGSLNEKKAAQFRMRCQRHGCFEYTRLDGLHDLHELHGQLPAGSSPSEEQSEAGSQPFGDFGTGQRSAELRYDRGFEILA